MGFTPSLLWLVLYGMTISASLVVLAVVLIRLRGERRARSPIADWPDIAIVDCGEQIHFLPATEQGHLVGAGRCPCQPRRTFNRRRLGTRVVYVDHRIRQAPVG